MLITGYYIYDIGKRDEKEKTNDKGLNLPYGIHSEESGRRFVNFFLPLTLTFKTVNEYRLDFLNNEDKILRQLNISNKKKRFLFFFL